MWASGAQPKTCRASGKKGHMAASCLVPKEKLYCKHCNMKSSHNTSACFKKQKEDKEKKKGTKEDKSGKEKPPTSPKRMEMSEERQQRDLSKSFRAGHSSPIVQHNSCVQLQLKEDNGNYLSWNNDDSGDDSYETPPETINTDSESEYDTYH